MSNSMNGQVIIFGLTTRFTTPSDWQIDTAYLVCVHSRLLISEILRFYPSSLERGQRNSSAVLSATTECYIEGVGGQEVVI